MPTAAARDTERTQALWHAYDRVLATVVSALIVLLLAAGFWQVFARFVLSAPPTWSEELMIYLSEWLVFLGAAIGVRMRAHISITVFRGGRHDRALAAARRLKYLATAGFLLVLLWQGVRFALAGFDQSTGSLGGSLFLPFLAVPVGALLMLIELLRHGVEGGRSTGAPR
jgi:TRAP-type C4-dicarboxylate transport system permease small subunit